MKATNSYLPWTLVNGFYYAVVTLIQLCAFVGLKYSNGIIILGIENVKMMIQVTCKVYSIYRVIKNDCQGFNNLSYTIHLR